MCECIFMYVHIDTYILLKNLEAFSVHCLLVLLFSYSYYFNNTFSVKVLLSMPIYYFVYIWNCAQRALLSGIMTTILISKKLFQNHVL